MHVGVPGNFMVTRFIFNCLTYTFINENITSY